jgi:maleylpyruvate isomerase
MTDDPTRRLDDDIAGCAAAHQRLHAHLFTALAGGTLDPRSPSRLPGWSVGHVLSHLARNADALRQIFEGAALGEERPMYPSAEHRAADIEVGSTRGADELVDDVRSSAWALESAWAGLSALGWTGHGLTRIGRLPVTAFPRMRWREVEVHHADLGLAGFSPGDWSAAYVAADLPVRLEAHLADGGELPAELAAAEPWRQLAWLLGRDAGTGLPPPPTF